MFEEKSDDEQNAERERAREKFLKKVHVRDSAAARSFKKSYLQKNCRLFLPKSGKISHTVRQQQRRQSGHKVVRRTPGGRIY